MNHKSKGIKMSNTKHVKYDYGYDNEPESVHHFTRDVEQNFVDIEPQQYDTAGEFIRGVCEIGADVILNNIESQIG